ncbi:MFS transporter [Iodidimonas sp. SYSU 1G8]|uniref:MFS transporter n=1 Tax=Iodidimonas sp. SYSU 1G8 TaxID=3133967 RepID=UPI0031FF39AB
MGDRICRKVALQLLPLLVFCYFLSFLDRVNISFAALTMNADLGFSATVYGWGAGIFFIGYILFEVPSNILMKRFGARIWIARIMVTWGLISACMSLVTTPTSFYILRFLLGFAEAGFFPGIVFYLSQWFPAAWRARIMGGFLLALPLSTMLGAPVSTWLLGMDHFGLAGWQWLFILEGLPTVLVGVAVFFILPNRPDDARWLTPDEKDWLNRTLAAEQAEGSQTHGSVRAVLASGKVWMLSLIYLGIVVGLYAFTFWVPQITRSLGTLSLFEVGLIAVIPNMLAASVLLLWGQKSDRSGERIGHLAYPALVGGLLFAASGWTADRPLLSYLLFCAGFLASFAAFPVFWTLPMALLSGTAAAAGIALINSVGNIGGFLGPIIIGEVKDMTGSYGMGIAVVGAFVFMSGLLTLALARKAPEVVEATRRSG